MLWQTGVDKVAAVFVPVILRTDEQGTELPPLAVDPPKVDDLAVVFVGRAVLLALVEEEDLAVGDVPLLDFEESSFIV